jgi:thioredoxin reductase
LSQGSLVDENLRTSIDGLYAAGDVTQGATLLSAKKEVIGLCGKACDQG